MKAAGKTAQKKRAALRAGKGKRMNLLVKLFVKDNKNVENPAVRQRYGRLSGIVGIALNALLFAGKFLAGSVSGSVAITADAVNNLSDAGSSIITLIGFKLAGKPADADHPFGHARMEYIASLAVAFIVLLLGVELLRDSVGKIFQPEEVAFSWLSVGVLAASIAVKFWMYRYNTALGKRIDSVAMRATAADSLSDALATAAVLLSTIVSPLIHFSLDGYMGVVVAGFILWSAIGILRDTMNKLLGEAPTQEMEQLLTRHILRHEGVLALHDMVVHSYGPGRTFATVHVEVDAREDILKSHDMIDNIEREVLLDHGVNLVIHLDPIVVDDPEVNALRETTRELVQEVNPELTIHDFRVVRGRTHSNLIFDVQVPRDCPLTDEEITRRIIEKVKGLRENYFAVVTLDRTYVGKPSHKTKMN